jgi:enamine deaminase RidA (YjgF/YER057c/UK114 family)
MPDNIRFSNPDTMQKPPGYSHVVEVMGPGRTVYFAGQLGIDKSGKMGTNAREQMEIAFENVKAALASVGASFENVVKLNNYIIDIGTNIAHYREVRDKYVNTAAPPASTTIGVPQLARPGALFEGEAIAVLPPKTSTSPRSNSRPLRSYSVSFKRTTRKSATSPAIPTWNTFPMTRSWTANTLFRVRRSIPTTPTTRARPRPRCCSQSNCPQAAATPNTSICTMPMMIFPRPPSEKSMG